MARIHFGYRSMPLCYAIICLGLSLQALSSRDNLPQWSILNPRMDSETDPAKYDLKTRCESWRMNVELNNIRDFDVVPEECVFHIKNYMTSTQYKADQNKAVEQALLHLSNCKLGEDGYDAWIFDIDDTLLSTVPLYKDYRYGGDAVDRAAFDKWAEKIEAPALEAVLPLYNKLKKLQVKIILLTGRYENLRDATKQNLKKAGFTDWTLLEMRDESDNGKTMEKYKSDYRKALVKRKYCILGNIGDQWSDIHGSSVGLRTFKLPNSMYYTA